MTKISVAWLILIAILGLVIFFSYQIATATGSSGAAGTKPEAPVQKTVRFLDEAPKVSIVAPASSTEEEPDAPRGGPVVPPHSSNSIPRVPGQTAEDLTMDEPLRATPPATQYDLPDATDPLNGVAFQDAEFGSNLRHPEQMIEKRPRARMPTAPGVVSQRSSPGGNNAQGYSTEMVQNGGDFMGAVLAFDGSEVGNAYSLL